MKTKNSMALWRVPGLKMRLAALVLALITVICMIPALNGGVMAEAGGEQAGTPESVKTAMSRIDAYLTKSDYTAWQYRSKMRKTESEYNALSATEKKNWTKNGSYYYSNNHIKNKNYYVGSCTWCALRDLLNRRVAYEGPTSKDEFFSYKEVVKVVSGNKNASDFDSRYVAGTYYNPDNGYTTSYIFIQNYGGADFFANHYVHTGNGKTYDFQIEYHPNDGTLPTDPAKRKEKLRDLLIAHPEGILVYDGQHGYLLTGYYTSGSDIKFYAHDTGDSNYGQGQFTIDQVHIGNGYGYANENAVIGGIKDYGFICNRTGNTPTPTPTGNPTPGPNPQITEFWVDLERYTTAVSNPCNIEGGIQGSGISKAEAVVINASGNIVQTATQPYNGRINIANSAINNNISFGKLAVGSYRLEVRLYDTNGRMMSEKRSVSFNIVNEIVVNLDKFKGVLTYGSGYGIPGDVTSPYTISKIEVKVLDAASGGQWGYATATYRDTKKKAECTVWPNVKLYRFRGSAVDNSIRFGALRKGYYYFEVKVTTTNGMTKTVRRAFEVR